MSYLILFGLGLTSIFWGMRSTEEILQLTGAVIGTILLIWALCWTPRTLLFAGEVIAVFAVFRICVRCCECDG